MQQKHEKRCKASELVLFQPPTRYERSNYIRGGIHDVYLYKQIERSDVLAEVAVKELRFGYAVHDSLKGTISDLTQWTAELTKKLLAIKGLDHPNLLRYYDFTCEQMEFGIPRLLLVMEYCKGIVLILQYYIILQGIL